MLRLRALTHGYIPGGGPIPGGTSLLLAVFSSGRSDIAVLSCCSTAMSAGGGSFSVQSLEPATFWNIAGFPLSTWLSFVS
mmetsp:Transcript_15361/g.30198  ORF Transcript_15361/g.30198 Transcript_15361/m.30198 type:complete len:80 (+) Transcript_15361:551-790(+)